MRKARFTEHQIIAVIKSVEAGRTVKDVCRLAEYAANMKPVIPDYDWIIFGVRVSHAGILFLNGAGFWVRVRKRKIHY